MLPLSRPAVRSFRALGPCTCRQLSTSTSLFAPFRFTALPDRALLSIAGNDAPKFLQGLISNDINHLGLPDTPTERLLYAGVLKADGRILQDIFIFPGSSAATSTPPPTPSPSYLIDLPKSEATTLRTYLKRHILRSKVKLAKEVETEVGVFAAWPSGEESTAEELEAAEKWLKEAGAGVDRRAPGMGWRWAGAVGTAAPEALFERSTPAHHHLHRLALAVPEGPSDWPPLPLEGNIDFMGGVDFKKGCYVGQELTARTHHRGVVRKRGVALRLFREGEDTPTSLLPEGKLVPYPDLFPLPPPSSSLTPLHSTSSRPRPSGKIGTSLPVVTRTGSSFALAFASVRLEHIGDGPEDGVFIVKVPIVEGVEVGHGAGESEEEGGRWLAKAFIPEWTKDKIREEDARKAEDS